VQLASGPFTGMWSPHVEPGNPAGHSWVVGVCTGKMVRRQGAAASSLKEPHRRARDRSARFLRTCQLLWRGGYTKLYVHASLHASDKPLSSSPEHICQTALRFECWTTVASER